MQSKDIPDLPILEFLQQRKGGLCSWFGNEYANSVTHAMPSDTPPKLVLAKMRQLMKRKLVDGCGCGCRGDFKITELGIEFLKRARENRDE